jgi:hypothetical protein
MIAAKLELIAPSCAATGGNSPVATVSETTVPNIMDRTKKDIAGCFFTNADIFLLSFLLIGWRGMENTPASLETIDR